MADRLKDLQFDAVGWTGLSAKFWFSRPSPALSAYASPIPERAERMKAALAKFWARQKDCSQRTTLAIVDHPRRGARALAVPEGPPAPIRLATPNPPRHTVILAQSGILRRSGGKTAPKHAVAKLISKIEDQSGQRLWLYREGCNEDGPRGRSALVVAWVFRVMGLDFLPASASSAGGRPHAEIDHSHPTRTIQEDGFQAKPPRQPMSNWRDDMLLVSCGGRPMLSILPRTALRLRVDKLGCARPEHHGLGSVRLHARR